MTQNVNALLKQDTDHNCDKLKSLMDKAQQKGATACETHLHMDKGFSVNVRNGAMDTIEHHQDRNLSITVYIGQQKGNASTIDLSPHALEHTLNAAIDIAKTVKPDIGCGLAPKERLAFDYPDLDLHHPWALTPEQAIKLALEAESTGLNYSGISNSEGMGVSTHEAFSIYANSQGFLGYYPSTMHSMSCVLLAGKGDHMVRDYEYTQARSHEALLAGDRVAHIAAEKTVARLNARHLKTQKAPVILAPSVAKSFWKLLLSAINGYTLYKKASFLLDTKGKQIFPDWLTIYESPHIKKVIGSAPLDGDGVETASKDIIKNGVLQTYLFDVYTANKMGTSSTGNAGGVFNLLIDAPLKPQKDLFKELNNGLYVTEVLGHGVDLVTGHYSQGVAGFWIEQGEIQFPVHEITIAGQMQDMFQHLVAVGNDVDERTSIKTGSVLLSEMSIAGK